MRTAETSRDSAPFPRPVSGFVGREAELSRVRALLPRETLFLIYGVAGIGKSELVYKIVEEARALPALRRASTVALAARGGLGGEHLVASLRMRLGAAAPEPHTGLGDDLEAVARALEARPALVFIDDAHNLDAEGAGDVLGYLARHVSRSRIFVASRLELLLPADTPPPVICRLQPLSRDATAELAASLSHTLGESPPDPAEVFARSGGSPLYVLREVSKLRYATRRGDDALAAALRELPPSLRQTLLLSCLLSGRFSLTALQDVEAAWELSRRFLIDIDRGMIIVHDLIGQALRRDAPPEELAAARREAASLLLRRAEAAPRDRVALVAQDVIEAIGHLAAAGEPALAWEAVERWHRTLVHGAWDRVALEILPALHAALPEQHAAVGLPDGEQAEDLLARLAMLELVCRCACDEVDTAAALLKRIGGRVNAKVAALYHGLLHHARGELPEARAALDGAYRHFSAHGDLLPAAVASHYLALTLLGLGDVEEAQAAASRAARHVSDGRLGSLDAHVAVLEARVHLQALRLGEAGEALSSLLGKPAGATYPWAETQAQALGALLCGLHGEAKAALAALDRAAEHALADGTMACRRELDLAAAEVLLLSGDAAGACARAAAAQAYYEARGRRHLEAQAALLRAAALVVLAAEPGDAAEALGEAEAHLSVAQALGERHGYALAWAPPVAAALWRRRGDERRARAELSEAFRLLGAAGARGRPPQDLESHLLRRAAAALELPGAEDAGGGPCPPGPAALVRALGLSPREQAVVTRWRGPAPEAEGRGAVEYDLVVDLQRNVIRSPGREQQVTGRPLLCALLAHLLPDDGVYSAERLFYEVWGGREYHPLRHRNTIYVAITRLRRALAELLPGREVVETTPLGWRLVADISLCVIQKDEQRPRPAAPAA
ncbi:ATP-binding protein [Polyangium aurulentum]|uniref:ATP-binding protein n=1 Tax=Polyangium aurulentum TaxID=2567896 RepID=UPI0010ADB182|nr:AAA family ATPase [Polyangium aurulentum]UQA56720.1 AAA family ATPase [Polyangium aurulentum]